MKQRQYFLCPGLIALLAWVAISGSTPVLAAGDTLASISDARLPRPFTFIAYGDMRFTDPAETNASAPAVRRALVERIASENPSAVLLSGDIPWHGGTVSDYGVYADETAVWRAQNLNIVPALGNHEFAGCAEATCLENWWSAFPALRGSRWYAVQLGSRVRVLALDSNSDLTDGSPQRAWLAEQLAALDRKVRFVLLVLHHPPVADIEATGHTDHNPRPNEVALADYLRAVTPALRARLVVIAGHTHNYERLQQDGIDYFVSGGGGAHPYPVTRGPLDRYQSADFPNFHYLRFTVRPRALEGEMVRVEDPQAEHPSEFVVRDRFTIPAK